VIRVPSRDEGSSGSYTGTSDAVERAHPFTVVPEQSWEQLWREREHQFEGQCGERGGPSSADVAAAGAIGDDGHVGNVGDGEHSRTSSTVQTLNRPRKRKSGCEPTVRTATGEQKVYRCELCNTSEMINAMQLATHLKV
jgi:hypothetical protein